MDGVVEEAMCDDEVLGWNRIGARFYTKNAWLGGVSFVTRAISLGLPWDQNLFYLFFPHFLPAVSSRCTKNLGACLPATPKF